MHYNFSTTQLAYFSCFWRGGEKGYWLPPAVPCPVPGRQPSPVLSRAASRPLSSPDPPAVPCPVPGRQPSPVQSRAASRPLSCPRPPAVPCPVPGRQPSSVLSCPRPPAVACPVPGRQSSSVQSRAPVLSGPPAVPCPVRGRQPSSVQSGAASRRPPTELSAGRGMSAAGRLPRLPAARCPVPTDYRAQPHRHLAAADRG